MNVIFLGVRDAEGEVLANSCFFVFRDIMSIYKEPPPGMFVVPDPHDMTKVSEYPELIHLLCASVFLMVKY